MTKRTTPLLEADPSWPLLDAQVPFRGIVEQSIVGLYIIQGGVLQYVNRRYAELYGYTREEMLGQPAEIFIHEADQALYRENMRKRISGEVPSIRYYLRGKHKDGRLIDMEAHGSRFEYRGRPAVIGVQIDISERMQYARELQENTAQLKAMAAHMPGVVYQLAQAQDGHWSFRFVSNRIEEFCGIEADALMTDAKLFFDRVHPQDRAQCLASLEKSKQCLADWNWEGRIQGVQGGPRWLNARASPRCNASGETLWDGLLLDISESKRKEQELNESHEQLRLLSSHLTQAREEQRSKIARELHDVLGGLLTAMKMDLRWLDRHVAAGAPMQRLHDLVALADEGIDTVRKISSDLRPGVLDNLGLMPAIEWQTAEFKRRLEIDCNLSLPTHRIELDEPVATAIFRIFQEALTNIARHAAASRVDIVVGIDRDELSISIEDDGCGISNEALRQPHAYGLRGMQARADDIGARLLIERGVALGTRILITYRIPPHA